LLDALDRGIRLGNRVRTWYARHLRSVDRSQVDTIWIVDAMSPIGIAAQQDIDGRSRVG
jgi:hypothetical protein